MSGPQVSSQRQPVAGFTATVDLKLEVVVIPVSDVDRAKRFYGNLGWRLDADFSFDNGFRVVQFTPPGSACSVQFGTQITSAAPGSAENLYLVVSDIEAARSELAGRGAEISEVFHTSSPGAQFQRDGTTGRVSGPAPEHASYSSFATFSDPDGNRWLLQEIKTRLPGRGLSSTDVATLTDLLRDAEQHHGQYEPTAPKHHWSGWYAAYIVARERGQDSRRGGQGRHAPHRRRATAGVELHANRHRSRRSLSRLRAVRPPRHAPHALRAAGRRSAGPGAVPRGVLSERATAARGSRAAASRDAGRAIAAS